MSFHADVNFAMDMNNIQRGSAFDNMITDNMSCRVDRLFNSTSDPTILSTS